MLDGDVDVVKIDVVLASSGRACLCLLVNEIDAATEAHLRTEHVRNAPKSAVEHSAADRYPKACRKPGQMKSLGATFACGAPFYAGAVS